MLTSAKSAIICRFDSEAQSTLKFQGNWILRFPLRQEEMLYLRKGCQLYSLNQLTIGVGGTSFDGIVQKDWGA